MITTLNGKPDPRQLLIDFLQLIKKETKMTKATRKEIFEEVLKQETKYFHLVWFARKYPEDYANPEILPIIEKVMDDFPDETENLADEDEGDWHHGFNSGALAAFRFVLTALDEGMDAAHQDFPMLDS